MNLHATSSVDVTVFRVIMGSYTESHQEHSLVPDPKPTPAALFAFLSHTLYCKQCAYQMREQECEEHCFFLLELVHILFT